MKIKKVILTEDGHKFYVTDIASDAHTRYGTISSKDLKNDKNQEITTNTGKKVRIFDASFIDNYKRMGRGPQIISLKDIGPIIAYTGVGKESIVADSGVGTGGVSCFLARYVKRVYAFDRKDSSINIAKENAHMLGLKNITFSLKDIYSEGLGIKPVDLFTLDVPDPALAIENISKYIKKGGYLVSYSPNISQVHTLVLNLPKGFYVEKTIENIERLWNVDTERSRPMTKDFAHTGFLTFIRKVE